MCKTSERTRNKYSQNVPQKCHFLGKSILPRQSNAERVLRMVYRNHRYICLSLVDYGVF